MKVFNNPGRKSWPDILRRPSIEAASLEENVRSILLSVKQNGDAAVIAYTKQFDGVTIDSLLVSEQEIKEASNNIPVELKQAIKQAASNIRVFHSRQQSPPEIIETMPGVQCWRKSVAIEKVGLYIPGGTAPLFSTLLMLGIPATIAGCREIVLCTPPGKNGHIDPAILYAASVVGVTTIIKAGGVQAIAAMAYGTATVPQVYKILGPGNQYVTCAKQLVQKDGLAIDMPAGPSEVAVYADETADASFVAADLLSQAEHGPDSQVLLVTTKDSIIPTIEKEIAKQLEQLPRKAIATQSLEHSKIIIMPDEPSAIDLLNEYAAEHLILS